MSYPLVSIVILNFDGRNRLGKILEECLDYVFQTTYPNFEVLFVDNASNDDSVEFIKEKFGKNEQLKIIQNDINYGFAQGNNIGISNSTGEYIVLLNTDARVESNWLSELVDAVQRPGVGAAQSKLVQMQKPEFLDCAGGLLDFYGYHFERGRGEKINTYNITSEIFYAKGACIILKRKVLEKTGLFDPDVFMYFDEADLCWRIRLCGQIVLFVPGSTVYHFSGLTAFGMLQENRLYFYVRNHVLMLLKNYDLKNMFGAIVVSFLFEMRNFALFLARRKPLASLAIIKAWLWNLSHMKDTWTKRQVTQKRVRQVSDKEIRKCMLEPCPPFPLYLVFSRVRYIGERWNINTWRVNSRSNSA